MSDAQVNKLRDLIEANPEVLQGAAGSGDVKAAAAALSSFAASKGVTISPDEVETAFQARGAVDKAQPLDDAALDKVAGGGSPWCWFTDGCYCFFTK